MGPRAWLYFSATSVIWGSSFLLIKLAVEELTAAQVTFARTALGALFLLPIAVRAGALAGLRRRLPAVALLALLDVAAPFFLTAWGMQWISSSLAGMLTATDPLFVALLALWLVRSERPTGRRLVGLVAGFAGVAALLGVDLSGRPEELVGSLAVLLAALGYAAAALYYRQRFADAAPIGVATMMLAISALALAGPALAPPPALPSPQALAVLAVLGAVNTGVGFWLFYALIDEAGAARASVITYVMPVVALVLGVAALGERVTAATLAGLLLILAGAWLATRSERRTSASA